MSGMAGMVDLGGRPVDGEAVDWMRRAMAFRATDGDAVAVERDMGLVFARSTSDPQRREAAQPLSLDGECWIVADARLDARARLVDDLRTTGWDGSRDTADAALILAGYRAWGEDVAARLLGDFAFAIWDRSTATLIAARDHLGVKPFFYAEVGSRVLFANTLACLRGHPLVGSKLNAAAIADFLLFEGNQDLATTSFDAIHRLPPAHFRVWRANRAPTSRRYWPFPTEAAVDHGEDWVARFRAAIETAVDDRLPTDRAAILLSGGLDSNAVAGVVASLREARGTGPEIRCYTSCYETLVPDHEATFAREAAVRAGFEFHTHVMDDCQMFDRWSSLPAVPEPTDLVLDACARSLEASMADHSRVVLTGHGGDPILSPSRNLFSQLVRSGRWVGAAQYLAQGYRRLGRLPPLGLHSQWQRWHQRRRWRHGYPAWLAPSLAREVDTVGRWRWYRTAGLEGPAHPQRAAAQRGLMDPCWCNYFERLDPGSRGVPLEHRHPLLDVRLVELAMVVPPHPWCVDKFILREASRGLVPESIRLRAKSPVAGNPHHPSRRPAVEVWRRLWREVPAIEAFVDPKRVLSVLEKCDRTGQTGRLDSVARLPMNLARWMQGLGSEIEL